MYRNKYGIRFSTLKKLRKAVAERNIASIKELCKGEREYIPDEAIETWDQRVIDEYRKESIETKSHFLNCDAMDYVIETQDQNFIVDYIRETDQMNHKALFSLYWKGTLETVEHVTKEIKFAQKEYAFTGTMGGWSCSNENYIHLLGKINRVKRQEESIDMCIWRLFDSGETDQLESLLETLKTKKFKSENIYKIAIRKTLIEAIMADNETWIERLSNHPLIIPDANADQLIYNGEGDSGYLNFKRSFEEAELDDLLAARRRRPFESKTARLRAAINQVMAIARNGGARLDKASADDSGGKENNEKPTNTLPADLQSNGDNDLSGNKRRKKAEN